jgi:hypothetical protein
MAVLSFLCEEIIAAMNLEHFVVQTATPLTQLSSLRITAQNGVPSRLYCALHLAGKLASLIVYPASKLLTGVKIATFVEYEKVFLDHPLHCGA